MMYYLKLTTGTLLTMALWAALVIYGGFSGWWLTPIAESGDTDGFYQAAVAMIESENRGNAALVLIEGGEIAGEYYSSLAMPVNTNTAFLTASMSKWFTGVGVMKLVQDGPLQLDDSVSGYLSRWQIPPGEFDSDQVTVRQLLSHTAGFSDGLGFGDYSPEETLPSVEESLLNPRASDGNTVNMALAYEPGQQWIYSGASYLILELLIEEITGQSFEDYMQTAVFEPLGMNRSTYQFIGTLDNNAGSYDPNGEPAPLYQYASSGATAFVTSGADLAKFVLSQIPESGSTGVLEPATTELMRQPHGRSNGFDIWGLGTILYAPTETGDNVFGHDGGNDPAINSTARINPDNGDAIIVLETGHLSLATEVGSQWVLWQTGYPDILDTDGALDSMTLPMVIGIILIALNSIYIIYMRRHRLPDDNT